MEVVAAFAASQEMLQQVEDLGIPLGPPALLLFCQLSQSPLLNPVGLLIVSDYELRLLDLIVVVVSSEDFIYQVIQSTAEVVDSLPGYGLGIMRHKVVGMWQLHATFRYSKGIQLGGTVFLQGELEFG